VSLQVVFETHNLAKTYIVPFSKLVVLVAQFTYPNPTQLFISSIYRSRLKDYVSSVSVRQKGSAGTSDSAGVRCSRFVAGLGAIATAEL